MEVTAEKVKIERYPAYKDSGVEWLGEIPMHWKVESFKNILIERNEKNDPVKSIERLSLSIDKGVTLYAEKTTNLDRFKDDFTQYKLAYKGDLVFNSMNMIVGAVGVSDYFGCVSPVYYTYHGGLNNSYTTKFYEYLFRCKTVQGVLYSLGKGLIAIDRGEGKYNTLRLKVSRDDLRSLKLPFPNLLEQTEIAQFLDEKTTAIDKAISIKEKQIELLKERRQILIHQAVTRGLNPDAPMKDSGVEWIGEIPAHWEVKRMKDFAEVNPSVKYNKNLETASFVPMEAVGEFGGLDASIIKPIKEIQKGYTAFQNNDVLVAKITPCYENFKGAIAQNLHNGLGFGTTELHVLRAKDNMDSEFIFQITQSPYFRNLGTGLMYGSGGQKRIGTEFISTVHVPCPPKREQIEIVSYIKVVSLKNATAICCKEKEIEKLMEYKASLINSAVTGKIKVC